MHSHNPAASHALLLCLQVVAHLQHTTLAQAFSAWVDFARQQSSTEGHAQQMAVSALARMRNVLLARALEASQAPVQGLHALNWTVACWVWLLGLHLPPQRYNSCSKLHSACSMCLCQAGSPC